MKLKAIFRNTFTNIVSYLFILLFVYAAISKLLDFENFQVQLRQSPLLSSFAGTISWLVPTVEILIALFLSLTKTLRIALYASYTLMVMFSAYIYIILNYSSFVPCSCGGILEKMDWTQHLIFNLVFVLLAVAAIFMIRKTDGELLKRSSLIASAYLLCFGILGTATIALLFVWSEEMIHHDNNFTRRFEAHAALEKKHFDLGFNSYYFSGTGDGKIYLGNSTVPALMTVVDTSLVKKDTSLIALDHESFPFRSVQVKVTPPYFYVMDGTVPCLFKGTVSDWKAKLKVKAGAYYELPQLTGENSIVFRVTDPETNTNMLGKMDFENSVTVKYHRDLLQKQIDGIFDTDGTLLFSNSLKKTVYVYYYRNEYIVANSELQLEYRGHTIDTTTKAAIKVAKLTERKQNKMNAPPQMVNRSTALHRNLLFVQSELKGQFESEIMWKTATIVDVYDIEKNAYLFSFYIYNLKGKKMRKFIVTDTQLFALIGEQLVSYEFTPAIKNAFKK